ncbi:lytic transglycosylase domain-containing protein [Enhygromyxa salina]|uniref:lytic transglycosylase domain-containing protein n=1 Tax=Enhygromyxa salina TaxID=215803 RepID=UPI0015E5F043|nr:lytic transglycosylase domain-containing protein [Enhygromyxa salina]
MSFARRPRWWPPPTWIAPGLVLLGLAVACATGSRANDTSAPSPASSSAPKLTPTPAPTPTPLAEVDVDAAAAEASAPTPEPEPLPFDDEQLARIMAVQSIVAAAAAEHEVDPALINALIWVESKFQRRARGPAGAQGLMQLMPKTAGAMAKRLGRKRNSYDPDFNIHAGTLLLSRLLDRFEGDVGLALAGYNRGGGTVSKWVATGAPLPEGVQGFIARVLEAHAWFERMPPAPTTRTSARPRAGSASPR